MRDALATERMALPRERVEKDYTFAGPDGAVTLVDLFGTHSQLIVYHFMFAPDWDVGCRSCSLVTDSIAPSAAHLAARDVALTLVSRAPLDRILPFKERMGWKLPWVSSHGTEFNADYQATTTEDPHYYNYVRSDRFSSGEQPGLSVFERDDDGSVFHTYSVYARGLEDFMATYRLLDVVPKGRDEQDLPYGMSWVRHHDNYGKA